MFKLISLIMLLSTIIFAAGESALVYMEIPVGARPTALGESFVSVADDPFTLMFNPAGLGQYPLNNGFDDIKLDTSIVLYDAVFKYDNNPEILMLLTNKGLLEYNGGIIKNSSTILISSDETVEDVVAKWTTETEKLEQYVTNVVELNNLSDIDYEETPIYEINVPFSIITEEKVRKIEKAPDGTLLLVADTVIVIQSQNGWTKLDRSLGLRGKIKEIQFLGNDLWVMTDKAMFSIHNYKLIDQTTVFEPFTSKPLRKFWNKFTGFTFVGDSTIWFKSKEHGVLEYQMKNVTKNHSLNIEPKKDYTLLTVIDADVYDPANYSEQTINGHTIYTIDSLFYKEAFVTEVVDTTKKDSLLLDSLAIDTIKIDEKLVEKIKSITFDSIFVNIDQVLFFINSKDSIYAAVKSSKMTNSYAKDFTSYSQVFKGKEVSDIIELDSMVMVLSEGFYYTKIGTQWKRHEMSNLKKGNFIGSTDSELYIQTSNELLKFDYVANEWSIEIQKSSIAGAYSEKGFFLAAEQDISIYKKTGISFAIDYQSLLPELNDNGDMYIISAPIVIPNIPIGALGISLNYVSYGSSTATDDNGNQIGTVHPIDMNFGAHWGVQVASNHSVGLGFKGYYSKLASGKVGTQDAKPAAGWLADLGYLYSGPYVNFGASVMNLGPDVVYVDNNQADKAPSVANVGVSSTFKTTDFSFMPTMDLSRGLWETIDSQDESDTTETGDPIVVDNTDSDFVKQLKTISPHGGVEIIYANLLAIRAGYLYDAVGERNYMPIGGGVKIHDVAAFRDLNIDFTYILSGFGDPFDNGGESINAKTFKLSIGAKLK